MENIKQFIIVVIIAAIIFGGAGVWLGKKTAVQSQSVSIEKTGGDTFQSGWEVAKKRLKETGYFPMADENMEIKSVNGEVTSVEGNKIALKIHPLESLADPELDNRIALTDDQTKFTIRKNKTSEQISKEMEEYAEKAKSAEGEQEKALIASPNFYSDEPGTLADIKEGTQVAVMAENNIKNEKQFKAVEIIILEMKESKLLAIPKEITASMENKTSENSILVPDPLEGTSLEDLIIQDSDQSTENLLPSAGE